MSIAAPVLAISIAWLYASTLRGVVVEWAASADASYGIVLAAVALVVLWRRRHAFVQAIDPAAPPAAGLALLLGGLALFAIGQLGADVFVTRVSFVVVVGGAAWFVAGSRAVRIIAAPLTFLLVAVPLPALLVNAITLPLQFTASRIAEILLDAAHIPVFRDGNVIELPSTTLEVAQACSGLRSMVSLAAIAGLLAWTLPGAPRRCAIIAASVPVAIVMNGLRIAATGAACENRSPRAAAGAWHTAGGWLTFVLGVVILLKMTSAIAGLRWRAPVRDALLA